MKNKGMTLVETLIGVSIGATAVAGTMSVWQDKAKKDVQESVANEIFLIASAVEKRILIDGYNIADWNKTTWNNSDEVVNDLLRKRLVAANSSCNGEWTPSLNSEEKAKLVSCDLWTKIPYGLEAKAELTSDATGFIEDFNMVLSFDDDEKAISHLQDIKSIKNNSRKNTSTGEGIYSTSLINKTTNNSLTVTECIDAKSNCALLVNYNRAGSSEYIRADGSNAMIGEHFKFIESRGQSPLKCVRWKNTQADGSGTWSMSDPSDLEECGIGIYKETGHPTVVDVVSNSGTFNNVLLDKECISYNWNGSNVVQDPSNVPCGMMNDSEAIMVVDNVESKTAVIENANFSVTNTNSLFSNTISANTIQAVSQLNALNANIGQNIRVGGNAFVTGSLNVGSINTNLINASSVSAPIGNFDNINNQLSSMTVDIASNKSEIDQNTADIVLLKNRMTAAEEAIQDLNSGGFGREELKKDCENRPDAFTGESRKNCTLPYSGTITYQNFFRYSWDEVGQFCKTSSYSKVIRRTCYRDNNR